MRQHRPQGRSQTFCALYKRIAHRYHRRKSSAFDTYAAYFGTYTIDAKAGTVSHHLDDNLIPGRQGTDNVRWFEFQGDNRLLLIPIEDGKGGVLARKDATYKLLWERIW